MQYPLKGDEILRFRVNFERQDSRYIGDKDDNVTLFYFICNIIRLNQYTICFLFARLTF